MTAVRRRPAAGTPVVGWEGRAVAALALVTLAAAPGVRGFVGDEPSLLPVLAAAAVVHAAAWGCRRRLGSLGLGAGFAAAAVVTAWTVFPGTTTLGVPLAGTWQTAASALREALEAFGTGLPPGADEAVPLREGRMALAVGFAAVCAVLADQTAFRLRRPLFALLPSLTLVLLGGLRAPSGPPVHLWLVAVGVFLLVDRIAGAAAPGPDAPRLSARLADAGPAAALVAAVALAAGLLVGPAVPGYGSDPLLTSVARRPGNGPARLQAFVDLRPTLAQRSDEVMFTVDSRVPAYWRLTSLDQFDGRTWTQSDEEAERGAGALTAFVPADGVVHDVRIEALRSEWLPAAYRVHQVEGADLVVAGDSSTLRSSSESRPGQRYRVVSQVPHLTVQSLRAVPPHGRTPPAALRRYLALPDDLAPSVRAEASRAAGPDGPEPLAAALNLQSWFRQRFTYDLSVPPGSGAGALERFLFETRRGYCEQFAGAFAVLARAAGLPTRVAVGFTPGDLGNDGRYRVRGLHAHAWPEVHLEGAGWVAFEPTPGRGNPTAEAYTGVPAAQASSLGLPPTAAAPTVPAGSGGVPATAATAPAAPAPGPQPGPSPTTAVPPPPPSSTPEPAGADGAGAGPVVAATLAVGALAAGAVPLVKWRRRAARRRRATSPHDRVMVAWEEAAEALEEAGLGRRPSETLLVHAARAAADVRLPPQAAAPVLVLARRAATASYGRAAAAATDAAEAVESAAVVTGTLGRSAPVAARFARALDPRPLWRRARG